jgi:hypothetical protein
MNPRNEPVGTYLNRIPNNNPTSNSPTLYLRQISESWLKLGVFSLLSSRFEQFSSPKMESIPESQSQLSLVSFQSPISDDFPEGDLVADLSGLALVDVGVTDSDVSGSPTMSLAVIEEFWMQFHNDNSRGLDASVTDLDSSSDHGKYLDLFSITLI